MLCYVFPDDKLPDFVDEEQEESIQERDQNLITESQMGAGTNELAEANMDDDNDGTPEDKDKEVKSSKKDDDRSASQPGEDDKKDEDMEGDDKEEKEDQQQEFQLENEKDVKDDVQKRDVLNESDRPEDKDSKDFSHVNPNESSEETTSAIDDIKNLPDDLKQKIEVKMNEDEKTEEETKPQGQSEKKTLEQELFKKLELKDTVKTDWVSRGDESIFASLPDDSMNGVPVDDEDMELDPPVPDQDLPQQPEKDAIEQWLLLCAKTSDSSHYLTEQLRMLIEPTKASRLKGDYRTGKRINMRKIIPYIASHYKKDKIWLRRTKPSRRECEIVIAIDDSSSMADNDVQGITKEALSMICQALSVLEIGKLGIVTYGEDAKVVQPLSASVSSKDGAKILSQITFDQSVTKLLNLMSLTKRMFSTGSGHPLSKLMLIISDGKGVLNEGKSAVLQSVRDFRMQNIFVVFLIVEAKEKTESVLDIRIPIFDDKNNLKGIDSYMDHFPFPYYIILKEIRTLPSVLSDALKQWFEMVNK